MFGYMNFMIIWKWTKDIYATDASIAPGIIQIMINTPLDMLLP